MKLSLYNIFVFLVISYTSLLIFGDKYLSVVDERSDKIEIVSKQEAYIRLLDKFGNDAREYIVQKSMQKYLNNVILLDSVIVSSYQSAGNYYLEASVNTSGSQTKAILKCSEKLFAQLNKLNTPTVFIAARINKITEKEFPYLLDNFEGELVFYDTYQQVELNGECLDLIEYNLFKI